MLATAGGALEALSAGGATLADGGGVLATAGMVPDGLAEAGAIGGGPLLTRAEVGGGGVVTRPLPVRVIAAGFRSIVVMLRDELTSVSALWSCSSSTCCPTLPIAATDF